MAWTWSLALADGWQRGVAGRLTANGEYLTQVSRFDDVGPAVRTFTAHVLLHAPDDWATQIAGHPVGAVLTFVGLDRIGLGGGAFAGAFVITVGSSTAAAVLLTLRLLAGEERARAAAPFVVLVPGAVWAGVSADGWFAAVGAWALALLAVAATRASRWATAVAGLGAGLLLGAALYLSYGMVLLVVPAAAVLLCARSARPVPYAVVVAAGTASVAGLRRVFAATSDGVRRWRSGGEREWTAAAVLLPSAFVLVMPAADLSGMSKAETERIWLPFTLWLPAAAVLLPRRDDRCWLAVQALVALLVNHLLLTAW